MSDRGTGGRRADGRSRKILLLPGDVRHSSFCKRAVDKTAAAFGHLDILVNNAAFEKHQESLADIDDVQLRRTFETNIYGYFYMARSALVHMREGAAINVGSTTGSITGLEGAVLALLGGESTAA